jgi:protein O-mannosyl-transferase
MLGRFSFRGAGRQFDVNQSAAETIVIERGASPGAGTCAGSWLGFPALRSWGLDATQTALLAGVILITALAYLRCLGNGFVFDDMFTIVDNPYVGQWSFLWRAFTRDLWWFEAVKKLPASDQYHPLQNVWFGIAYHAFGKNPLCWHLVKIALHLIVVVLSFRLAQIMTKSAGVGLLTALLFGLLPVHAEAVVWASDIPEPLCTAFELGAMYLFIGRTRTPAWRGIKWSLLAFAGALLSHEMAVVFPLLIAAYVFLFETDQDVISNPPASPLSRRVWKALALSAPFFAASLLYMCVRAAVLGATRVLGAPRTTTTAALVNRELVFHHTMTDHTLAQTAMTIPTALVRYLELLLFPWQAGPAHSVKLVTTPGLVTFWAPVTALLTLALLGYLAFRRARLYFFLALWFVITLVPVFDFDRLGQPIADRYLYLPSFAFCLLLADWAIRLAESSAIRTRAVVAATALTVTLWTVSLWRVEPLLHDNVTLFAHCVQVFPDSTLWRQAYAAALFERGEAARAAGELEYALKLAPQDARLHMILGMIYMEMHRESDATRELSTFYQITFARKQPSKPHKWVFHIQ